MSCRDGWQNAACVLSVERGAPCPTALLPMACRRDLAAAAVAPAVVGGRNAQRNRWAAGWAEYGVGMRPTTRMRKWSASSRSSPSVPRFPYYTSLREAVSNYHFCGSTLIGSRFLLTAAQQVAGMVEACS